MDLTFRWCVKAHTSVSKIVFGCFGRFLFLLFSVPVPNLSTTPRSSFSSPVHMVSARRLYMADMLIAHEGLTLDTIQMNLIGKQIAYPHSDPCSAHYATNYTIFVRQSVAVGGRRRQRKLHYYPVPFRRHKNSICESRVCISYSTRMSYGDRSFARVCVDTRVRVCLQYRL